MEADVPFLPLLDHFLEDSHWSDWLVLDGVHLNGEGHRRVFQRVSTWSPLLEWAELRLEQLATPMLGG
jgi:hypothetical protein